MIKSAVTISLVKEAEGGPFIFWHDLAAGCAKAAELGYVAVEVFAPNADAIPVDELRGRLGELDASRPIITVCHSGMRAYIAARILQQSGFDNVHNLTGGMLMQRFARPELFE